MFKLELDVILKVIPLTTDYFGFPSNACHLADHRGGIADEL